MTKTEILRRLENTSDILKRVIASPQSTAVIRTVLRGELESVDYMIREIKKDNSYTQKVLDNYRARLEVPYE